MNGFITFREKENNELAYFILGREFPHYIGIISIYPKEGAIAKTPIAGYNLWVVFHSTLRGAMIPSYKNVIEEIQSVMENMATFYLSERILPDATRYKKFKLKIDDNSELGQLHSAGEIQSD